MNDKPTANGLAAAFILAACLTCWFFLPAALIAGVMALIFLMWGPSC